jgi:hypothetical protein
VTGRGASWTYAGFRVVGPPPSPHQAVPSFRVFAHQMRGLGTPTQPCGLFEDLADRFPQDMWVGFAHFEDEPVAGAVGFR